MLDGVNTRTALGLPRRWSNAGSGSGASDHFPVSAKFRTVSDGDASRRLELDKPGTGDAPPELARVGYETLKPDAVPRFSADAAKDVEKSIGEFFLVDGKVSSRKPLAVEVHGAAYEVWLPDPELRKQGKKFPVGAPVRFIGELGTHKGKLQFAVLDPSWLIDRPAPAAR